MTLMISSGGGINIYNSRNWDPPFEPNVATWLNADQTKEMLGVPLDI